ncbi:UvrD-helicase domain-containing protein [Azotobacter chroococcum]|uniref:UvrD-helicase domain-containing protein n=1 Tax=Azotobacter chroococcum TaxID=353 RepID=UPI0010AE0AE8|nr:UvrD-helicase domain-containing protein [Azotobacter chroococcum]TKD45372.1 ATP-dependent helicase [Azotobacter chroococcum]
MQFTHEQEPAIRSLARILKLIAFAGTGKTTTLVGYAQARPQARILYLCYNKSVEVAAKQKFPLNVTCKTSHGLAYGAVGTKYKHKLCGNLRLTDIARAINSQNWEMVRSVQDTLNNYLASADEKIRLFHFPPEKLQNERMRRAADSIVEATRRLWAQMCDVNNHATPIPHDGYLKLWALSKPDLSTRFDIVLGDEAQDINPVIAGLLAQQAAYGMGVVVCGDGHQMLYRFRGAVDALDAPWLADAEVHYLTQSFRFGPAAAHVANMLLHFKGERRQLAGLGQQTRIAKTLPADLEHRAILCRTVVGVIEEALAWVETGAKIFWVGGIEGYNLQDLEDLHALSKGWRERIKGKKLLQDYPDYDQYKDVAFESQDSEMTRSIKIVEQYGKNLPELFAKLRRNAVTDELEASVTLSTAHRAKGLEWEAVQLAEDFSFEPFDPDNDPEAWVDEMNLLYVACTRAMQVLAVNSTVLVIMQEFVDRRDGRKPDAPLAFQKKAPAAA